jgi:2-polyprenyl-6-methoxyphenol hydroxylase-like FAD-dependent oxidoreductase
VDARVGYASRMYALPPQVGGDWKVVGLGVKWPDERRGGAMLKVEGGRVLVTLVGAGGTYPPADEQGFLRFASRLADPVIHDTIAHAAPLTPVVTYRALKNRRRHFEELPRWPERFVVLGDAVSVFNPIYAQGMTVGVAAAALLDARLAAARGGRLDGLAVAFQRDLARALRVPWLLATIEDRWWASDRGEPVSFADRASRTYIRRLHAAMSRSPALARRFLRVMHMTAPPATLLAPAVLARMLWVPDASDGTLAGPQPGALGAPDLGEARRDDVEGQRDAASTSRRSR